MTFFLIALKRSVLGLTLLCLWLSPAAADDAPDGATFAIEYCGFCHGYDGNSAMARFPSLAGLAADYTMKQLRDFRSGRRHNDDGLMASILLPMRDADLAAAAEYYAAQVPRLRTSVSAAAPAEGARLYREGRPGARTMKLDSCASCHSEGAYMPYAVSGISAQPEDYLKKQLEEFRSGRRRNDPDQVMQQVAIRLTAEEIAAVSLFLASRANPDALGPDARRNAAQP